MQTQVYSTEQLGLEALTICPKKNQTEKHCNSCMMTCSVVSASLSSLNIGDYIGMESCFDLNVNDNNNVEAVHGGDRADCSEICSQSRVKREKRCERKNRIKREFPPPIPSLAGTAENRPSHMPWVLKRYYTDDGRLILREEKVRHHEFFKAHRSNGRLTLHLIPFDDINEIDNIDDAENDNEANDHEEAHEYLEATRVDVIDICNNNNNDDKDDHTSNVVETLLQNNIDSPPIEDFSIVDNIATPNPIDNGNIAANGVMCLNYNRVGTSPTCFLGLPVPAMRPVHT